MKQISIGELERLALADQRKLKREIEWKEQEWVRDNARYIADIESKRIDKTCFGEWPKGWQHEMRETSKEIAKRELVASFANSNCMIIDGAIWLNNWQIINELEGRKP